MGYTSVSVTTLVHRGAETGHCFCAYFRRSADSLLTHLVEKLIKVHTSTKSSESIPLGGYGVIFKERHGARAISTVIT